MSVQPIKTGLALPNVLLLVTTLFSAGCSALAFGEPTFNGTVLDPPVPAADFALPDQHGETFRLADVRGKVVVMTFLYTSCIDVCPFISIKLRQAIEMLGDESDKVEFIVISTDPERDTLERVSDYSRTWICMTAGTT